LHPILVNSEDNVIGFILLSEPPYVKPGCDYCIQEFFILKKYRKKGFGIAAINELFKAYKGQYSLLILEANIAALNFWRNVHSYNGVKFEEGLIDLDFRRCYYQVFEV
jgi:predicted acetyltransferase